MLLRPELQKERSFPHPSKKKNYLKFKRESTRFSLKVALPTMALDPGPGQQLYWSDERRSA